MEALQVLRSSTPSHLEVLSHRFSALLDRLGVLRLLPLQALTLRRHRLVALWRVIGMRYVTSNATATQVNVWTNARKEAVLLAALQTQIEQRA
jgi:hypothetical protein